MLRTLIMLAALAVVFTLWSCGGGEQSTSETAKQEFAANHGQAGVVDDQSKNNILQIAAASPDHKTLVVAVQTAQLENVLVNPGPLTVFAPNDAAFGKLPPGTVDELLKPENRSKLTSILTSHASPGTFDMDYLTDGAEIYLATGQYVNVEVKDGATYINGAKILGTVDASNGIVHVIDSVFLFD